MRAVFTLLLCTALSPVQAQDCAGQPGGRAGVERFGGWYRDAETPDDDAAWAALLAQAAQPEDPLDPLADRPWWEHETLVLAVDRCPLPGGGTRFDDLDAALVATFADLIRLGLRGRVSRPGAGVGPTGVLRYRRAADDSDAALRALAGLPQVVTLSWLNGFAKVPAAQGLVIARWQRGSDAADLTALRMAMARRGAMPLEVVLDNPQRRPHAQLASELQRHLQALPVRLEDLRRPAARRRQLRLRLVTGDPAVLERLVSHPAVTWVQVPVHAYRVQVRPREVRPREVRPD